MISISGCGNGYSMQKYKTVLPTTIIERGNSDKIIGFLSYYVKNQQILRPVCFFNTKLIVYSDYTMKTKHDEIDLGGRIADYKFSLFNDAKDHTSILSMVVENIKMQLLTITFYHESDSQTVFKLDIDPSFNKIIAVYNIATYHKFTLLHSSKLNKIKSVNAPSNAAIDFDVKSSVFSDVSCINQKEKMHEYKELDGKTYSNPYYLVSYNGRMLDFYDFVNGEMRHADQLDLEQEGNIGKADMDFGTIYGQDYEEPQMFNLSVYDGKTLFIVDLVNMKVLTRRDVSNYQGSLYHSLFQFEDGLYYYDYHNNSLRLLKSGQHRLLQSSSFFTTHKNNLFYAVEKTQNISSNINKILEYYVNDYYETDDNRLEIKDFVVNELESIPGEVETFYFTTAYSSSHIVDYDTFGH